MRLDPDGLRYVATILVWAHWFVVAFSFVQLAYRPAGWPERYVVYAPLFRSVRGCRASSTGGQLSSNGAVASLGAKARLGIGIGAWTC